MVCVFLTVFVYSTAFLTDNCLFKFICVCLSVSVYERAREGEREGRREVVSEREGEREGGRGKGESFNCSVAHLITMITVGKS